MAVKTNPAYLQQNFQLSYKEHLYGLACNLVVIKGLDTINLYSCRDEKDHSNPANANV